MLRVLPLSLALSVVASGCFRSPESVDDDGNATPCQVAGQGCAEAHPSTSGSSGAATGSSSSGATSSSGGACQIPAPGGCSSDDDCVLAFCSDDSCDCGGGVIARSQLGENPCLVAEGTAPPPSCAPHGPVCDCPASPLCIPRCEAGACACEAGCASGLTLCDGACVDTSGNLDDCGACGNACASGQLCLNGVCSSPDAGGTGTQSCSGTDFCACTNFCVSTCRCSDGGCSLTEACDGAVCPNSCPTGEACSAQPGGISMCSPTCSPDGVGGQGSCQAGMTCETVCT